MARATRTPGASRVPRRMTKFKFFPKVPPVIKHIIWDFAIDSFGPQVLTVDDCSRKSCHKSRTASCYHVSYKVNPILHVCLDARKRALVTYNMVAAGNLHQGPFFINFKKDVLRFNLDSYENGMQHLFGYLRYHRFELQLWSGCTECSFPTWSNLTLPGYKEAVGVGELYKQVERMSLQSGENLKLKLLHRFQALSVIVFEDDAGDYSKWQGDLVTRYEAHGAIAPAIVSCCNVGCAYPYRPRLYLVRHASIIKRSGASGEGKIIRTIADVKKRRRELAEKKLKEGNEAETTKHAQSVVSDEGYMSNSDWSERIIT
ncbi:hypothetical protein BDZ45DRAFT_732553 [Acephala macrosclerotiorum]|nr:hypothetical protein BDZ45DRAFT_732553 [Acephala macrosclerotiorum]